MDIINLSGAPAQNWTSLFSQMAAQLAWGSIVSGLTWWLWVPALSPLWAAAYPAEADLDLDLELVDCWGVDGNDPGPGTSWSKVPHQVLTNQKSRL